MQITFCSKTDFLQIHSHINEFWGSDRALGVHHPMFVHEFGDTAYVIKNGEEVMAYLFGFFSQSEAIAYVHLVGVREPYRRRGLARQLYDHFIECARARGCSHLKAITTPGNSASIAFHKSLGMRLLGTPNKDGIPVVENYSGMSQDRVVFDMNIENSINLVEPCYMLRESYRGLIDEMTSREEKLIPFPLGFPCEDFDQFLAKLQDNSNGIGLPNGFVANSTFWLVRNNLEVVGVSNLRHNLTPALQVEGGHIGYGIRPSLRQQGFGELILAETLLRAKERGLKKVLLTCGKGNVGSSKIILSNGGLLASEEFLPDRGEVVQRYWIELESL